MTIREHLHDNLRHAKIARLVGFVVFAVGGYFAVITGSQNPVLAAVSIAAIVAMVVIGNFIQSKACCPKCGNRLGKFLVREDNILLVWRPIDYCPYCGVPLDSEFEES